MSYPMGAARDRQLFLKWALLNLLTLVLLVGITYAYGGRVHGPSLLAAPVILLIGVFGSGYAGRICWRAGARQAGELTYARLLHDARYLLFWAWLTPMIGILSTILGFWLLLSAHGSGSQLHDRIMNGGGVALVGTFVGVLASLLLTAQHRMIEHDLER